VWSDPAPILLGTALSETQLNATTLGVDGQNPVAGSFSYTLALGTVLDVGSGQLLSATFTSSDRNYTGASGSAHIDVWYDRNGVLQPVDNNSVLNKVKAGSTIPVKFNLSGNQG
jgi:hypothetical protein